VPNELLLNLLIFTPVIGAVACLIPRNNVAASKGLAMATAVVCLIINLALAWAYYADPGTTYSVDPGQSVVKFMTDVVWIESVGIHYLIGVDGLSMPLLLLTSILNILIIAASWNIQKQTKGFMALYLLPTMNEIDTLRER